MLVQPYVVAFMSMSSQDVLFVTFDQIFVHVVIIAFVQLERVGFFNCTYCQDGCVWCIRQIRLCVQAHTFAQLQDRVVQLFVSDVSVA